MKLARKMLKSLPGAALLHESLYPRGGARAVSTDSRSVKPGDLYAALKGERFDGHDFVGHALKAGASVAMVSAEWGAEHAEEPAFSGFPLLLVPDTLRGLGALAAAYRMQFEIPIVAIAGSTGKTTVKELTAAVLGTRYNVLKTEGNLNNQIGVPLTLLRLEKSHEAAVIELGTNHFGEIAGLVEMVNPTHGVITNVGRAHLEFFGSLEGVAIAKGELLEGMSTRARAFLNADDPYLRKVGHGFRKVVWFGIVSRTADVRGKILRRGTDGTVTIRITRRSKGASRPIDIPLRVPGEHNAMNSLAAAAVGFSLRIPARAIKEALASYAPPLNAAVRPGRMEVIPVGGVRVINDTYNANPDSMRAALRTLAAMECTGKKIVVLADMFELGPSSGHEHATLGLFLSELGFEYILTTGPQMHVANESSKALFARHFDSRIELSEGLNSLAGSGDIVLVKGSRGMKMEEVVASLVDSLRAWEAAK